jgi:hypothetical protein
VLIMALNFCVKFLKMPKKKIFFFCLGEKTYFLALNRTVVLRAKFRSKIVLICQNRTSWQVCLHDIMEDEGTKKIMFKMKVFNVYTNQQNPTSSLAYQGRNTPFSI